MSKPDGQNLPTWWEIASHSMELGETARVMGVLLETLPVKSSFQQGMAFVVLAAAHARNEPMTMSEMVTAFPNFSNAIRTGYTTLVDELGWLKVETDETNKRRKVLKLTEAGMAVVAKMAGEFE